MLLYITFMATAINVFGQQALTLTPDLSYSADDFTYTTSTLNVEDTTYQKKLRKLQDQMQDLQKQMSKIRSEQYRKNAEIYRKNSEKLRESLKGFSNKTYVFADSVSGFSKGLGVTLSNSISRTFAYNDYGDDYVKKKLQSGDAKEKIKNYSKSYSVDRDDKIQIENKFGKVTVNTWNKNEVKVDIQIKADADDDDAAQKLLDRVSIGDSKSNSVVSFKTTIDNDDNNNWGTWINGGRGHVRKIEVNYTIYMPAKTSIDITNKYGSTELPDLTGKVVINNSYGSLLAKGLSNPDNTITVKYGSARIDNIVGSDVNVAYGNLVIGESDKLNADISYGSAKIGKIRTSGSINAKFSGTVQVADVDKNVKSLSVTTNYSSVKIGLGNNPNADFDVTVKYGNFDHGNVPLVITTSSDDDKRHYSTIKTYKGKLGKGDADKVITVKSTFGSVKFD